MTQLVEVVRRLGPEGGGTASVLEILVRVTALLIVGVLVALALRRASAALRHLVWTLSLLGTLLVPFCYWAFPAWQWAILPQREQSRSPSIVPVANDALPEAPITFAHSPRPSRPPAGESFTVPAMLRAIAAEHFAAPLPPQAAWSWPASLAAVWALGTFLGLAWLGTGIVAAWLVARRAQPAADSPWRPILRQLLDQCGCRRPVEVRQCGELSVPMTWGLRRPVILVPINSVAWSEAAKRSVLLHELGHIRRGDCLFHLLGRLACAVYWFHPLAWWAAKQLRRTSEQAADDAVLSSQIAPPDYAEHLLQIAAQVRGVRLFGHVALPMASPSDLEGRVRAILDPKRNHRSLKRRTCCALMTMAALLLIPCALLRLGYAQSPKDQASSPTPKSSDSQPAPAVVSGTVSGEKSSTEAEKTASESKLDVGAAASSGRTAGSPPPQSAPAHLSATGKVLNAAGKPLAGASVYLCQWSTSRIRRDTSKPKPQDVLAQCQTDAQGEFRFQDVVAELYWGYQRLKQQPWDVVVIVPGSAIAWRHLTAPQQPAPMIFQLQPEAKIAGRVMDEKGQPLEGVEVSVAMISALGSELFDLTPTAEFLDLRESRLAPRAKTGADGRVTLGGLPPQRRLWLDLQRPGRHAGQVFAATTEQPQPEVRGPEETPGGDVQLALIPVQAGSFTAVLRPTKRIIGTVVDAHTGEPLAGIDVYAVGAPYTSQYSGLLRPIDTHRISDNAGRFVFPDLPKRVYRVFAGPQKAGPYLGRLRIVTPPADQPEVDVRMELPRGEPVAGRVLSKKDGKGIPEVSVVYKPKDGDDVLERADGALSAAATKTDSDGRFRLLLPPGTGSVVVSPQMRSYSSYPRNEQPPENVQQVEVVPGHAHAELVFSIGPPEARSNSSTRGVGMAGASTGSSAGKAAPYPFAEVRPPIVGKVVDPEGRPVADATVGLQPWFESRIDTIDRRANSGSSFGVDETILAKRFAHTDASGRFSLGEVGVNEWGSIEAIQRERQLVGLVQLPDAPRPGSDESPLTIWLSAAGSVSGSAQKDGEPCRGVRVTIREAPLRVVFGRNDNDLKPDYLTGAASEMPPPLASFEDSTETDAQGRFRFATVPANKEFMVRIYARDLVPEKNRYSARVKAGENTELPPFVFIPTNESISGIVVDSQGKPVAGATLLAYTGPDVLHDVMIPKARVKSTGADGRFTMTGLPKIPVVLSVGLMVPDGAGGQRYQGRDTQIRVQPGQTDVRIEVKQKPTATEGKSPPSQP